MKQLYCELCGSPLSVSYYFSLKESTSGYEIECTHCRIETTLQPTKDLAIQEWNSFFPTLFD